MSDARNLGETAFVLGRAQPSAEIVRVGCAKPRRNCVTRFACATLCGDRACRMCEIHAVPLGHWNALIFVFALCHWGIGMHESSFLRMSRTKRSFWKVSLAVFANVSYETLILEGPFVSFCECLVRNAHFGSSLCQFWRMSRTKRGFWKVSLSVFANVSYETLILEGLFVSFCECLVRNAHFGSSLCQFLRMSRTKRSFWKVSLSVFANVSYETLIFEVFLVRFCECLVRNAHFGSSLCQFLRMSRTKRSFWKVSLSVFANVSYETLIFEVFLVRFCECLVRNAHFGRSLCQFLRMSRTKRSFWKVSLSVFANVSYETLILEGLFVCFCECLVRNAHFERSLCQFLRMSRTKRSFWKVSLSVFANVSYETLILKGLFVSFCECLVRNAPFGRSLCQFLRMSRTKRSFWKVSLSVFANVSYETLLLKGLFVSFCECLVRNAHFGRSLCQFLRMSRTKRSFWKHSLSVFANVSYETLILEGLFVSFCECLVRNAHFGMVFLSVFANVSYETLILEGLFVCFCECLVRNAHFERSLCQFLRMSRTKRSFWKVSLSVFANVSYETLILQGLFVSFCECLVRNVHFGRFLCLFLRMSRTKRSFWKLSLSVLANVSYETLILEDCFVRFCECLVRNAHFGRFS